MSKKQIFIFISLWFFTIGIFFLGFSWLVLSGDCDLKRHELSRTTGNQDNLVLFYSLMDADNPKMKGIIESREVIIKQRIENFKTRCRSKKYKNQLVTILKQYEIYLKMKQAVLKERQDFDWHQELFPPEFVLKK